MKIIKTIDGSVANDIIIDVLPVDLLFEKKIDFVGFVLVDNYMIISAPKKFKYSENETDDLRLIYNMVLRYNNSIGYMLDGVEEMFPLDAYLRIYDYYKKYGIFSMEQCYSTSGYKGDILWKKTINRSKKIISGDNLVFIPFHIKRKEKKMVFLSECMDYILFDGCKVFLNYLEIMDGYHRQFISDIFDNSEMTIIKLKELLGSQFKDTTRNLINYCIKYFEWKANRRGTIKFYVKDPALLWQRMVHTFINNKFAGCTNNEDGLIVSLSFYNVKKTIDFEYERPFKVINDCSKDISVRVDHFSEQDRYIYIFDSKYYGDLNQLNYKQVAYYYMLKPHFDNEKRIISALLFPSRDTFIEKHIDRSSIDGLLIFCVGINVNEIIINYVNY